MAGVGGGAQICMHVVGTRGWGMESAQAKDESDIRRNIGGWAKHSLSSTAIVPVSLLIPVIIPPVQPHQTECLQL